MTPPGLAWLDSFCGSTGTALDQGMLAETNSTVNQLVYKVRIKWSEPITMPQAIQVWNLFQKWAGKNQSTPSGRVEMEEVAHPLSKQTFVKGFSTDVHLRERLGHPKNEHP